ncbi:MAG: MarR family transcriptional regulator [Clostridia bacterium]|nr:MarR family transcriptional regulator [Clostridia bacterium]
MISKSNEEYLKTMYILQKQLGNIRVTDIANKMNCSKPSVNKALNNLKDSGLILYETYGPIELTKEGEELAKKILEAYDIVYVFLKDVLNMEESIAKEDAERMKSSITDDTINSLAKYVHKVLDLGSLDCDYDVNKELCRSCVRRVRTVVHNQ